jgi:DNA-binding MarR family transcriptional regulator
MQPLRVYLMRMERRLEPHDLLVALLSVQNVLERQSDAFFQPFGLTGAQFNILNLLAFRAGRMEQMALVRLLLVGKSSVSVVLTRLVRHGLVRREEHPVDRRQTVLILTPKGKTLWKKVSLRYEAVVRTVFGRLPLSRRPGFVRDLQVIHQALLIHAGLPYDEAGEHGRKRLRSPRESP